MDTGAEGKSRFIPAEFTPDGTVNEKRSSLADAAQFREIQSFIENTLQKAAREILEGKIAPNPYKDAGGVPCDRCKFRGACLFDPGAHGGYRKLLKCPPGKIFEKIKEERNEDELDN
jgi:ATP-dependent helicase/nuclease subunit B